MGMEHLEDSKNGEGMTLGPKKWGMNDSRTPKQRRNDSRTPKMGKEHLEDLKNGEEMTPGPKE